MTSTETEPGVELVWTTGHGYICPRCRLFVAHSKSDAPRYCPRCPAPTPVSCAEAITTAVGEDENTLDFETIRYLVGKHGFDLVTKVGMEADHETAEDVVRHLDRLVVEINRAENLISSAESGPFSADFDGLCHRYFEWRKVHRGAADPVRANFSDGVVPSSLTLNLRLMIGAYRGGPYRSFVFTPIGKDHGRKEIPTEYFLDPEKWEREAVESGRYRLVVEPSESPRINEVEEVRRRAAELGFDLVMRSHLDGVADASTTCLCGHLFEGHSPFGGEGNGDCLNCLCPRFRPADTSGSDS